MHDHVSCGLLATGGDDHVVVLLGDRPHRAAQADRVAELGRHPLRHQAGAAVHQALLRAVLDGEEHLQAVVAAHEHQQVEQRHLVEVAGVEATDRHLEQVAGDLGADARRLEVLADRGGVPLGGLGRGPRFLERAPASTGGRPSTAPGRSWRPPAG